MLGDITRMETATPPNQLRWWKVVRYLLLTAILAWSVLLFVSGELARGIQILCIFALAVSGAMGCSSARSKDSWSRIVAVGIFVVAAAILVSALVISARQ